MALCGTPNFSAAQTPLAAKIAASAALAAPPAAISTLDAPFLFAYGTWQNKVKIENGKAILRGAGVTPKGGGGCNIQPPMDLSANPDYSPALKIKVGAANKMGLIRLMLRDMDGHSETFEFLCRRPAPTSFWSRQKRARRWRSRTPSTSPTKKSISNRFSNGSSAATGAATIRLTWKSAGFSSWPPARRRK